MRPVLSVTEVLEGMQRAKARASNYSTNFFPTEKRLQEWVTRRELQQSGSGEVVFYLRRDRDFWHLYHCAGNAAALEERLGSLPESEGEKLVVDLVGKGDSQAELTGIYSRVGFRLHGRLLRLAFAPKEPPVLPVATGVEFASGPDAPEIVELLERHFDKYAEQIPLAHEIEAAVSMRQVLVVKWEEALAGLLFFETQGVTSTLRFWAVAEKFRELKVGSKLMRHYLASQSGVKRFVLWVADQNLGAIQKYQHYGYAPDGLVDEILVNRQICA
jgi:ribosomal protein S18 acetylase RimI-like enzyme